jgi:hypothetical protein
MRVILITALIALLALPVAVHAQDQDPVTVTEDFTDAVNNGDVDGAGENLAEDATVMVPQATSGEEEEAGAPAGELMVSAPAGELMAAEGDGGVEVEGGELRISAPAGELMANPMAGEGGEPMAGEGGEPMAGEGDEPMADPAAQTQYSGTAQTQAWIKGQVAANATTTLGACSAAGDTATCPVSYTSDALQAMGVGSLEGTLMVTVVEGVIQSYDFTPSAESVAMLQAAAPKTLPATGGNKSTTYVVLLAVLGLLLAGSALVGTRAFQRRGA